MFKTIKGISKWGLTHREMSLLIFINKERQGVSESCLPDKNTGIEIFKDNPSLSHGRHCRQVSLVLKPCVII